MSGASITTVSEIATREAYGKHLVELGRRDPQVVVVDADLSGSTKTNLFAKEFPQRFFNVGVAEQNLMGVAAGLAHSGKKVFVSTFAMFAAGRAWEIVRQSIAYPHLDVKICATHAGITVGEDGASHQIIEDVTLMRVIPGMKVCIPADALQTVGMMDELMRHPGPAYLRLSRAGVPAVFSDSAFALGKGHVLRQGSDVCIFVCGFPTHATIIAAEILTQNNISASVVCLGSVKPIDTELVVEMAKKHRVLFSIEEHNILGGLGGAIAEVLCAQFPARLVRLGMNDEFGQSAPYKTLLKYYRLDAEGIAQQVRENLEKI